MTQLLTPQQAGEMLQKPVGTMKRWRAEGNGPTYVKIGRDVRYRLSDLEAYINENTHVSSVREFMEDAGVSL
jgi:predicted DNA-binding transcriptional regulator AlpA